MKHNPILHNLVKILLIIGGLNWGLIGLFQVNLVNMIFGDMEGIARVIYTLVGLAAVVKIVWWVKCFHKK